MRLLLWLFFLLLVMGGTAGIVGAAAERHDAAIAIPVLGFAGTALAMFLACFSLPGLADRLRAPQVQAVGADRWNRALGHQPHQHPDRDRCSARMGSGYC